MEWLLTKPVVVSLAIIGAVASTLASALQSRGTVSDRAARWINHAGYGFMAASMLLFIVAGFRT